MASTNEDNCFSYKPLTKPTLVRLLRIMENKDNEPLKCELEIFDLDTNGEVPRYAALSYTWGPVKDRVPLICAGKVLQITTKLDDALRKIHVQNSTKYIWVDQVCISQDDPEEKARQIQLMTAIFQTAWVVLAWLGPSDDATELAIEQVQKVANTWKVEHPDDPDSMDLNELMCIPQDQDGLTSNALRKSYESDANAWLALSRFFDRPWFERAWIVQELVNATMWGATRQIEAFAICGQYMIQWMTIYHAALWIQNARNLGRAPPADPGRTVDGIGFAAKMHGIGFASRRAYMAITEGEHRSIGSYTWGTLKTFRNFAARKATDPRDIFFALYGLTDFAQFGEIPGVTNSMLISSPMTPIDYSLSLKDTFRDFAKGLISWYANSRSDSLPPLDLEGEDGEGPLDVLLDAKISPSEPDWPSWVPDWRLPKSHNLPPSSASKGKPDTEYPQLYEHPDPDCLKVAGVILGMVDWINDHEHSIQILIESDPHDLSKFVEKRLGPIYQHGLGSRKSHVPEQRTGSEVIISQGSGKQESTAAAFLWTLSAGTLPQLFRQAGMSAERYEQDQLLYKFLDLLRNNQNQNFAMLDEEKWNFCKPLKDLFSFDSLARFDGNFRANLCCRRIFTTDTGYVGTADLDVRAGHIVALLFGMSMPVILQPARMENGEQVYRLVGDAWVRGVMDGEIIDDLRESGASPDLIVLR